MWEILFEAAADRAMTALEQDTTRTGLRARVDAALQALAANPGDARCRRQPYPGGMWDMAVRTRLDDWLIVWMYGPGDDEVTVIYVGPKP
jgi:hypothetical protein